VRNVLAVKYKDDRFAFLQRDFVGGVLETLGLNINAPGLCGPDAQVSRAEMTATMSVRIIFLVFQYFIFSISLVWFTEPDTPKSHVHLPD